MSTELSTTVRDTVDGLVTDGMATLRGELGDVTGERLPGLHFANGLATTPSALPRKAFGLLANLVVPPGTCAVVYVPGGELRLYQPGSHLLWDTQPGAVLVQWVDMRRRQVPVGPIEGWSADKWRVRLWLVADIVVTDPALVAAHGEPLAVLAAAMRVGALRFIEQHTHAALTGCEADSGGMDAPAATIAARLREDPALAGLQIIAVRVVERQGDERQVEAATQATVAAAQIDEELRVAAARQRATLQALEGRALVAEREHHLRLAATAAAAREQLVAQQAEVQQATLAARLDIVLAQVRAQAGEVARDEQRWQAEQTRLQAEWEHTQRQQLEAHHTDQQLRLMDAQGSLVRVEGEAALAAEERRNSHLLALAEVQERIAAQRATQAEAIAERRAQHEQTLLDLRLRHEQLVGEQLQSLEQWRAERVQVSVQQQRQHDRQLAAIAGTAQIAAAAATRPDDGAEEAAHHEVAEVGLRALQVMAE